MFSEYFEDQECNALMPGIRCCFVTPVGEQCGSIPIRLPQNQVEIFFCIHGELTLRRRSGQVDQLGEQGILLLSDCSHLTSVEIETPLEGVCLTVDDQAIRESFFQLCQGYGTDLDPLGLPCPGVPSYGTAGDLLCDEVL